MRNQAFFDNNEDPFFSFFDSATSTPMPPKSNSYCRARKILLPPPQSIDTLSLEKVLLARKTAKYFSEKAEISLQDISTILFWTIGVKPLSTTKEERRFYPSGGSLYPIEIYLTVTRGRGIKPGIYHYSTNEHALEFMEWNDPLTVYNMLENNLVRHAPLVVFFSSVSKRSTSKYGSLGYKLILLEGGHVAQNFYLVCASLGLGILPIGRTRWTEIRTKLGIDNEESIFYLLAIGPSKD